MIEVSNNERVECESVLPSLTTSIHLGDESIMAKNIITDLKKKSRKLIKLDGKKFGRLTVIGQQGSDRFKHALWLCRCDCGNEMIIASSNLIRNHSQSCGCLRLENIRKRCLNDLTGLRFGRLLVIKREGIKYRTHVSWLCKCDCGKEIIVTSQHLRRRATTSCGCYMREIVTGPNSKQWTGGKKEAIKRAYLKRKADIRANLNNTVSVAICNSLRKGKDGYHWEDLVGYTLKELMNHLQKRFHSGMSWSNYGRGKDRWEIDHMIPKSIFSFKNPHDIDFKRCWSLNNLQPMWSSENRSKHDKILYPFHPTLSMVVNQ